MKMLKSIVLGASLALGLAACDSQPPQSETERFNTFLDERFDFWVGRSPTWQSYLGIKDDYGQWDDESAAADDEDQALYEEDRGIAHASVRTAVAMSDGEQEALVKRLSDMTGKSILIEAEVDPQIIGGMVVRIGDRLIDGSTRTRLITLRRRLQEVAG